MGVLDKALKSASRASQRVVVCLDGAGASERDRLFRERAALKPSDGRMSKSPARVLDDQIKAVEDKLRDSLLTVEVEALPAPKWSQIKRECPPDNKDALQRASGFNVDVAVQKALIASSWAVDGDEREPIGQADWARLHDALSGGDWDRLVMAVLGLNQSSQAEAIARGKG